MNTKIKISITLLNVFALVNEASAWVEKSTPMAQKIFQDYVSMRQDILSGAASKNTAGFIKKHHLSRSKDDDRFIINRVILAGVNRNLELAYKDHVITFKDGNDVLVLDLSEIEKHKLKVNGKELTLKLQANMSLKDAYQLNKEKVRSAIFSSEVSQMTWFDLMVRVAFSPLAIFTACSPSQGGDGPGFASTTVSNLMKPLEVVGSAGGLALECVGECLNRTVNAVRPYSPPQH